MSAVLDRWSRVVAAGQVVVVLPDGCRDAILVEPLGDSLVDPGDARPFWTLSPLDAGPRPFVARSVARLTGFRLHPAAARPDLGRLTVQAAEERLARTPLDPRLDEAQKALALGPSVAAAARALGVSTRTLQRLCQGATGQGPLFWLRLARARRAARGLADGGALAEVAAEGGFADQAHLTREVVRWFGLTPARLRSDPGRLRAATAPGYGTGVQISTRVPSGART